jgi:dipeptidyl aminopeptidase/acylaminoacyl peptidase
MRAISPASRLAITLLAALAASLLSSAPAGADTILVADHSARNITSYASTSAWSRRANDGTYRLVVMGPSGVPADAAVRPSSVPFDPDLGPTSSGGRGVVYSRCLAGSTTRSCDVYLYDVGAGTEHKVAAVSGRHTSEIAPSYFKGAVAFTRTSGGLFVYRPGKGSKQILKSAGAVETDLSATRVIARVNGEGGASEIRVSSTTGRHARFLESGAAGEESDLVVTSPILTRYRAFWLRAEIPTGQDPMATVSTVSLRSATAKVQFGKRRLDPGADAIALGPASTPRLYSGSAGISLLDPPLQLGS